MADEPADYGTVLLLDPGLVVLAVGPGPGEFDAPVSAVLHQGIVDEGTIVVRVNAENREWQLPGDGLQSLTTRDCSLAGMGTAAVQPVHTSVATRL